MEIHLYDLVKYENLKDMLETFYHSIGIPIQLLDTNGKILETSGETAAFCSLFQEKTLSDDSCALEHIKAGRRAMALGEPYIFSCHAGLNHIVFPLMNKDALLGSVQAGPFLLADFDSVSINDIAKRYSFTTSELFDLYDESKSLPVVSPKKARYFSRLLYYMFFNLISDSKQALIFKQNKFHQQSRINESIQMYKTAVFPLKNSYPYDKERMLITKLKLGATSEAKAILNDLLGYVLLSEGSNLDNIKSRSIELCSLLSRASIEGGAPSDRIFKINNHFLSILSTINDIDNLCYELQTTIDVFIDSMFERMPRKNNEMIKKAIYYISQNYSVRLSLDAVAGEVHLNPAYFSTLFKQSTGSSFKEYLNIVRIEESKKLLSNTEYPLMDIAIAVGFENQSYFSKVFKKLTGLTPKQYRNS